MGGFTERVVADCGHGGGAAAGVAGPDRTGLTRGRDEVAQRVVGVVGGDSGRIGGFGDQAPRVAGVGGGEGGGAPASVGDGLGQDATGVVVGEAGGLGTAG